MFNIAKKMSIGITIKIHHVVYFYIYNLSLSMFMGKDWKKIVHHLDVLNIFTSPNKGHGMGSNFAKLGWKRTLTPNATIFVESSS